MNKECHKDCVCVRCVYQREDQLCPLWHIMSCGICGSKNNDGSVNAGVAKCRLFEEAEVQC